MTSPRIALTFAIVTQLAAGLSWIRMKGSNYLIEGNLGTFAATPS